MIDQPLILLWLGICVRITEREMTDCSCGLQVDKNYQLKAKKMFHLKEKENILSDILRYVCPRDVF